MVNTITLGDVPNHLQTYAIGVLAGMGIDYEIAPGSSWYKVAKEYRREKYLKAKENGETSDKLPDYLGYHLSIQGGDSVTVSMRPVCTT